MQTNESRKLVKIFCTGPNIIRTFRSNQQIISIGSGRLADLQIKFPSLEYEHLRVDLENQKLTALGHNVHCDDIHIELGQSASFTNNSVVRINNLVLGFYSVTRNEDLSKYDNKILEVISRYKQLPIDLTIEHCNCSVHEENSSTAKNDEFIQNSNDFMKSAYDRNVGSFSTLDAVDSSSDRLKKSKLKDSGEESNKASKSIIEETKREIQDSLKVADPPKDVIEAFLDKRIEDVNEDINEAINKDFDISVKRQTHSDLGKAAIKKELLQEAKKEIHSQSNEELQDKVKEIVKEEVENVKKDIVGQEAENIKQKIVSEKVEKELEVQAATLENFKQTVAENIKEELKDSINDILREEVKNSLTDAVSECIVKSDVSEVIADKLYDRIQMDKTEEIDETEKSEMMEKADENKKEKKNEKMDKEDETKNVDETEEKNIEDEAKDNLEDKPKPKSKISAVDNETSEMPNTKKIKRKSSKNEQSENREDSKTQAVNSKDEADNTEEVNKPTRTTRKAALKPIAKQEKSKGKPKEATKEKPAEENKETASKRVVRKAASRKK